MDNKKKRRINWEKVRIDYEIGASQSELSRKYKISRSAIQKHIAEEGWTQEVEPLIHKIAREKVAGIVAGCSSKNRADAIDTEANRRAEVVFRHRLEWDDHKELISSAVRDENFEVAKLAKITAETIQIRQTGERKAWGIDVASPLVVNNNNAAPGITATKDEVLDAIQYCRSKVFDNGEPESN